MRWRYAAGPDVIESREPARPSEIVGSFDASTADDVRAAVAAARAATATRAGTSNTERANVLRRTATALRVDSTALADLISREVGKRVTEAAGEIANAAAVLDYFGDQAEVLAPETIVGAGGTRHSIRRQPLGVVAAITPWNFPVNSCAIKLASAFAFGNTAVLKPAEQAPASAVRFVELMVESGAPEGVVNLLIGDGSVGAALAASPGIDAISFTGSTAVGRSLQRIGAASGIRVQCELGGKNALVVTDDADLELATQLAVEGAFRFAGQRCTATSRVIATREIAEALRQSIVDSVKALSVGSPSDPDTFLGPLITAEQRDSVANAVETAVRAGAHLDVGGERLDPDGVGGHYYAPTVLSGISAESTIAQTEVFGPVLCFIEVADVDEAIAATNATNYGLTAAIATSDPATAETFIKRVQVGAVAVNSTTAGWDYHVSIGGWKESGSGYPEQGPEARTFFTRIKTARLA